MIPEQMTFPSTPMKGILPMIRKAKKEVNT